MTDATNPFRPVDAPSVPPAAAPAAAPVSAPAAVFPPPDTPAEAPTDVLPEAAVGPVESVADPADAVARESDLLEQLEADLGAVETAIATIERISTDGVGGEQAAVEIGAAVSVDRFGTAIETATADSPTTDEPTAERTAAG